MPAIASVLNPGVIAGRIGFGGGHSDNGCAGNRYAGLPRRRRDTRSHRRRWYAGSRHGAADPRKAGRDCPARCSFRRSIVHGGRSAVHGERCSCLSSAAAVTDAGSHSAPATPMLHRSWVPLSSPLVRLGASVTVATGIEGDRDAHVHRRGPNPRTDRCGRHSATGHGTSR